MREQEPIIGGYVDLLISQLHKHRIDPDQKDPKTGLEAKRPVNLVEWYNWTTFDVISDLAFGEPFGSLARGKEDSWVTNVRGITYIMGYVLAMRQMGLEGILLPALRFLIPDRSEFNQRVYDMLAKRMEMKVERPDLIEGLLKHREKLGIERLG